MFILLLQNYCDNYPISQWTEKQVSTIMIISQLTKQLYISVFINGWITQTAILQIIP